MISRASSRSGFRAAFSLIELVVVVSIIAIIAVFAVPAASTMIRGTDMNRAEQILADQINFARLQAVTKNKQIEVRFLQFADPEIPGENDADSATWVFRAVQLLEVSPSGVPTQLTPIQRMPTSVIIEDTRYSSILDQTGASEAGQKKLELKKPEKYDALLPRKSKESGKNYKYIAFRFNPDGSTDLSKNGKWYVTVLNNSDKARLKTAAPSGGGGDPITKYNYYTLQVDPVTGATHSFRTEAGSASRG